MPTVGLHRKMHPVLGKVAIMRNAGFGVVVVGGGFSGAMLAVQLLRRVPSLSVAVIDKGSVPGRGLAYGTKHHCHLLNVPAGNMSALPEEPDHFLRWARANYDRSVQATSFLPRPLYGRYVGSLVEDAIGRSGAGNFQWIQGEVSSLAPEPPHTVVRLKNGSTLITQALVLAVGNYPPANLNIPGLSDRSERYFRSPWSEAALKNIPKNGDVLLIGSGLTSVDVAVALKSEGFAGHIHILSRHGLMPQTHRQASRWPQFWNDESPRTTRGLLRLVREQVQAAAESGSDWRAVIDALRLVTQKIWQSLPLDERRRFLRHVRPYWDIHRHRIASEIGDTIARLIHDEQASVYGGRVTSYREHRDYVEVGVSDRKTRSQRWLRVDRVINCTGPETDCRRIDDPLIKNLLAQGLARPDPLFLGLDVDSKGALIDFGGNPSPSLYAVGPARKGSLWETIAVPEIRTQASELAEHLAGTLLVHSPNAESVTAEGVVLELAIVALAEDAYNEEPLV
jgi:uncharacterized NAD(P)/FAD-binding protein YdhS